MSFFAIGIPCFNCAGEKIDRLLDSIATQKDVDLTVYMCDDSNNDELEKYYHSTIEGKYNFKIVYYRREPGYHYHCPGNTRRSLVNHFEDCQYICFADNDDKFEENCFKAIYDKIIEHDMPEMVFTNFTEITEDGTEIEMTGWTWTHGNFYNFQWIKDNNINFKKDLYTHEDLYWSGLIDATLTSQNIEVCKIDDVKVYRWLYDANSLTRKPFKEDHYFIERHLNDYIHCASDPWIQVAKAVPAMGPNAYQACISALLYSFFYYQASIFRLGNEVIPENIDFLQGFIYRIQNWFGVNKQDIINKVYSNPILYNEIKGKSFSGGGAFIETVTFKDFMNTL